MRSLVMSGLALGLAGTVLAATASPARADWNDWHHGHGHGQWHGHRGPVRVAPYNPPRYYAPPPVYYTPPQAYYAPPPVYYGGGPSVTFSFN
ncbi:MAG TPA: hypothetical protein VIJ55_02250 [Acetobacteraceae bacterium]